MRAISLFSYLALGVALAVMPNCSLLLNHRVLYEQNDAQIGVEDDPTISAKQTEIRNAQPAQLSVEQLRSLLNVVEVSGWSGTLMGVFVAPPPLPFLTIEELQTYSNPLTDALKQAGPTERVFFSFPKPGGNYSEDRTAGALFLRGRYLHIVVTDHSSILRADTGGDNLRDIRDTKGMKLWIAKPAEPASVPDAEEPKWAPFEITHVSLNYSKTLALLDSTQTTGKQRAAVKPSPSLRESSPDEQNVEERVRQLTDSNRELREQLNDQSKKTKELSEEMGRLRQELDQPKSAKPTPRKNPAP
jgi:hypothetical protein